jgi:hypothetical protein
MPAGTKEYIKASINRLKAYYSRVMHALFPMREKQMTLFETHGFLSDEIENFRAIVNPRRPNDRDLIVGGPKADTKR